MPEAHQPEWQCGHEGKPGLPQQTHRHPRANACPLPGAQPFDPLWARVSLPPANPVLRLQVCQGEGTGPPGPDLGCACCGSSLHHLCPCHPRRGLSGPEPATPWEGCPAHRLWCNSRARPVPPGPPSPLGLAEGWGGGLCACAQGPARSGWLLSPQRDAVAMSRPLCSGTTQPPTHGAPEWGKQGGGDGGRGSSFQTGTSDVSSPFRRPQEVGARAPHVLPGLSLGPRSV